jgi:hypothetical protein
MTRRKSEITGHQNERDLPHLVELPLPPGGFHGQLSEFDAFHRERHLQVRRGGRSQRGGAALRAVLLSRRWDGRRVPRSLRRQAHDLHAGASPAAGLERTEGSPEGDFEASWRKWLAWAKLSETE